MPAWLLALSCHVRWGLQIAVARRALQCSALQQVSHEGMRQLIMGRTHPHDTACSWHGLHLLVVLGSSSCYSSPFSACTALQGPCIRDRGHRESVMLTTKEMSAVGHASSHIVHRRAANRADGYYVAGFITFLGHGYASLCQALACQQMRSSFGQRRGKLCAGVRVPAWLRISLHFTLG